MEDEVKVPMPEAGQASGSGPGREHSAWVEDLAGPDDFWLTLTDAARVTRRQEVTIRRWVASGTLPVRNRPLGLNKRTRHVRASDLARLSPIVDASATISSGTAQIDLLSIPVQQAEILAQNAEILAQNARVQQQMLTLNTEMETTSTLQRELEQRVETIKAEAATRSQQAEKRQEALGRQVGALKQTAERLSSALQQVKEEQKALQELRERDVERVSSLQKAQSEQQKRIEQSEKRVERIAALEKRQAEETKARVQQERRIEDLAAQLGGLVAAVRQVQEALAHDAVERRRAEQASLAEMSRLGKSLAKLGEELSRQKTSTHQQAQTLQRQVQEAESRSQQVHDQLARQAQLIDQVAQQVRALDASMQDRREEKSKAPRRGRAKSSV